MAETETAAAEATDGVGEDARNGGDNVGGGACDGSGSSGFPGIDRRMSQCGRQGNPSFKRIERIE